MIYQLMEKIEDVLFYTIDKSIKSYRQFAQKRIKEAGFSITIDQWLVLKNIQENPEINQYGLSRKVFKDTASVTRIIDLLVKSDLLKREINEQDRRKNILSVTKQGNEILTALQEIVLKNRAHALEGIEQKELELLKRNLQKIIDNVSEE